MWRDLPTYQLTERSYEFAELLNSKVAHIKERNSNSTICSKKGKWLPVSVCDQDELCDNCHAMARKLRILQIVYPVK